MPCWECFLCAKKNNENEKNICICCKRPRDFAPKSYINRANAQPLALHGIATGVFPFRIEQIDALVTAGLDLGAKDTTGWTALHCAARTGDSNVVATILEKQPTKELIEATTQGGWRALHHAVACGHLGVVEELLAADAEIDPRIEKEGLTPLHLSAMLGYMEITDLLLQCGANPHATTTGLHRTALHLAVGAAQIACARVLLVKARDLIGVSDAEGMSPYQQAQLLPASKVKEQLIKLLELNQHPLERTPLLSPFLRDAILRTE